jgi:hypothetical protein
VSRGYPERQDFLRVELHGETDDRFDAAKVLLKHQPLIWKHRAHQVIDALARLKEAVERKVAKVVMAQLLDLFVSDERLCWANLSIISDDDDLLCAQKRGQLCHVRLRSCRHCIDAI